MTEKMLKFTEIDQETPNKRGTEKRKGDFNEIYDEFIVEKAKEQSSRCSQCGVPFCQVHCPLHNLQGLLKRVHWFVWSHHFFGDLFLVWYLQHAEQGLR